MRSGKRRRAASDGRRSGPGWVVAAAFLGPGTVTTATLAGARFGSELLWALLLAVLVAVVLQEAAARTAMTSRLPVVRAMLDALPGRVPRGLVAGATAVAVAVGNAAFQAGNLAGASLGLAALVPAPPWLWAVVVADLAFLLLWFGRPGWVEATMKGLVGLMASAFLVTLALTPVDWGAALAGVVPSLPGGEAALLAVALIGTTVVPYNLFLHGSLALRRGWRPADVRAMRRDTALAIAVGGALSMAIVLTSAAALRGQQVNSAADMARQLDPLLGPLASGAFAVGLFAAGMTSAVTAPLAAAYVVTHVLPERFRPALGGEERAAGFRAVWASVLLAGLVPVLLGLQAVPLIVAAQALNGLLLPLVAALVVAAAARAHGSTRGWRWAGWAAVGVAALLGARLLASAAGIA